MLPFKKPAWIPVGGEQMNQSELGVSKFDISSRSDNRRMKMQYEYVKVKQYYSVLRFPARWCYPV